MKKSKKIIIYMLVALVVAVSAVLVDFGNCYAQSIAPDVLDADWKYFSRRCDSDDASKNRFKELEEGFVIPDIEANYPSILQDGFTYTDTFDYVFRSVNSSSGMYYNVSVVSISEVVFVLADRVTSSDIGFLGLDYGVDTSALYMVSQNQFISRAYRTDFDSTKTTAVGNLNKCIYQSYHGKDGHDFYVSFFLGDCGNYSIDYDFAFRSGKLKVFTTAQGAYNYFVNGDLSGLAWQGGTPKQTYSSELAFTSFDMSVHDSNSFDDYYIDFVYKCPDSWLGKDVKLVVNQTWDYDIVYFNDRATSNPFSSVGSNTFLLSVSRNSVSVPLGQFDCLKKVVSDNFLGSSSETKRRVLGSSYEAPSGSWFTFEGLPLKADASYRVDKSFLSLSCVVYVDGVAGHEYLGSLDLVSGDNSMSTYTPDSGGNYTYNNDYKKGGRYYTDVGKDAAGNTTYNYYYYNTDNSKHEVTSKDSHDNTYTTTEDTSGGGSASGDNSNNNVNNPTFNNNNNITIEGDTINNDVNNIVGSNTSTETNKNFIEKFLGFFQLLENNSFLGVWGKVFGWLPPGISSVITTALGISACVGLFRFFRR